MFGNAEKNANNYGTMQKYSSNNSAINLKKYLSFNKQLILTINKITHH